MSNRLMRIFVILMLVAAVAASAFVWQTGGSAAAAPVSVIVELKDDPGAVYKAKSEKAGRDVSEDALQSYRASLTAKQDQFLQDMRARGISYNVETLNVQDFAGQTAATTPFRFSLVYNGVTLAVPQASIAAIKAMHRAHQHRDEPALLFGRAEIGHHFRFDHRAGRRPD